MSDLWKGEKTRSFVIFIKTSFGLKQSSKFWTRMQQLDWMRQHDFKKNFHLFKPYLSTFLHQRKRQTYTSKVHLLWAARSGIYVNLKSVTSNCAQCMSNFHYKSCFSLPFHCIWTGYSFGNFIRFIVALGPNHFHHFIQIITRFDYPIQIINPF